MSEQRGEVQLFGHVQQENVTADEYQRALENLERFAAKDINEIATLEDLAFEVRFVGKGVHTTVLASGELEKTPPDDEYPERGYIIKQPVEDGTITATSKHGKVYIDHSRIENGYKSSKFNISLPIDKDITASEDLLHNANIAHALDRRGGKLISYYPAKEPHNPDMLRGYASILQEGVKDILSVAKKPTQLPPELK